jgi:hypothetical protein
MGAAIFTGRLPTNMAANNANKADDNSTVMTELFKER